MISISDININKENHFQSSDDFLNDTILSNLNIIKLSLSQFNLHDIFSCNVKCPDCGKSVLFKINEKNNVYIDDCFENKSFNKNGKIEYTLGKVDKNCFNYNHTYTYSIKTKSNKFVVANDLRKYLKTKDCLSKSSINSTSGINDVVKNYSKDNVICVFVGNNFVSFDGNKDLYKVIEPNINEEDDDEEYTDNYLTNFISCDLWWIMSVDINNINMEKLKENNVSYVIIDVEENSLYNLNIKYNKDNELSNILLQKV